MKSSITGLWILCSVLAFFPNILLAQNSRKEKRAANETLIKNTIESKQYVFSAQSAHPLSGGSINLTSSYELKVYGDSIICDLPYFGRAFSATAASGGGVNFISANAKYTITNARKGGWDIRIQPKDVNEIRELTLSVSPGGYTTVTITSNSRESISYYGEVRERKYKKN